MHIAFEVILLIVFMASAHCVTFAIVPTQTPTPNSTHANKTATIMHANSSAKRLGTTSPYLRREEISNVSTNFANPYAWKDQRASAEPWILERRLHQQRETIDNGSFIEEEDGDEYLRDDGYHLEKTLSRKGPRPTPSPTCACCDDHGRRRNGWSCQDFKLQAACQNSDNARRRQHIDEARKSCPMTCGVCQPPCSKDADCAAAGLAAHECENGKCKEISTCDESVWPDVDGGIGGVCGDCKVLITRFKTHYKTCNKYCADLQMACKQAWEEKSDTCQVKHSLRCDEEKDTSDAICECMYVGKCKDRTCSAGKHMPKPDKLCKAMDCTEEECCEDLPRCETFECEGGSVIADGNKQCKQTLCTHDECCTEGKCEEGGWPDKDKGLICGDCKVLVDHFDEKYTTCRNYCYEVGFECTGAWEEEGDTCDVKHAMGCDTDTLKSSDAICECAGPEVVPTPEPPTEAPTDSNSMNAVADSALSALKAGSSRTFPSTVLVCGVVLYAAQLGQLHPVAFAMGMVAFLIHSPFAEMGGKFDR